VEREPGFAVVRNCATEPNAIVGVFTRGCEQQKVPSFALARNSYLVGSETKGMEKSFPFFKMIRGETRTDLGS
jgi:hypothetical protein